MVTLVVLVQLVIPVASDSDILDRQVLQVDIPVVLVLAILVRQVPQLVTLVALDILVVKVTTALVLLSKGQ